MCVSLVAGRLAGRGTWDRGSPLDTGPADGEDGEVEDTTLSTLGSVVSCSRAEWKAPRPQMAGRDADHRAGVQLIVRRRDGGYEQVGLAGSGEVVAVPKEHEGRTAVAVASEEGAEVRVARHDDASVRRGCVQDLVVGCRAKRGIEYVKSVVTCGNESASDGRGEVGVDEELHAEVGEGSSRSLTAAAAYSSAASTSSCSRYG